MSGEEHLREQLRTQALAKFAAELRRWCLASSDIDSAIRNAEREISALRERRATVDQYASEMRQRMNSLATRSPESLKHFFDTGQWHTLTAIPNLEMPS